MCGNMTTFKFAQIFCYFSFCHIKPAELIFVILVFLQSSKQQSKGKATCRAPCERTVLQWEGEMKLWKLICCHLWAEPGSQNSPNLQVNVRHQKWVVIQKLNTTVFAISSFPSFLNRALMFQKVLERLQQWYAQKNYSEIIFIWITIQQALFSLVWVNYSSL